MWEDFHARLLGCIEMVLMRRHQDISRAGNQKGLSGERSSLCTHFFRLIDEDAGADDGLRL